MPDNIRIHPVIHVDHTARVHHHPATISSPQPVHVPPFIDASSELVNSLEEILLRRRRVKSFQFLTLYKGALSHEDNWKRRGDFSDEDGAISTGLHFYIIDKNILPDLQ